MLTHDEFDRLTAEMDSLNYVYDENEEDKFISQKELMAVLLNYVSE
jgi:hypothetical protein